jgi:hypothetical protein
MIYKFVLCANKLGLVILIRSLDKDPFIYSQLLHCISATFDGYLHY